jgi:hypothetical protein
MYFSIFSAIVLLMITLFLFVQSNYGSLNKFLIRIFLIMIDILLKLLPIFVAIGPLFVWLDKAQRFSHRRKFYAKRIEEVKVYIDKYYKKSSEIEKDCAAQLLVGSEKVGHLEVDYVIEHYPQRFFNNRRRNNCKKIHKNRCG